ncbi:MAG: CocE/NonD family hydrolase [Polyangiaceae bacterium]
MRRSSAHLLSCPTMEQPGFGYAFERLGGMVRGWAEVTAPQSGVRFDRDVEVRMRDGVVLRVNVFRPEADAKVPVIVSAHPYGKDALPRRSLLGYRAPMMYRIMRQPGRARFSAWTSWEAPDPGYWASRGYAVVNCDLRGFHRSDGEGSVFSHQQGRDVHDVIEWIAAQPWSSGKVGMCGVSYLAISQWLAAAERPPHLAAICPWEGFTDAYRDLGYPGGVREDGFVPFWANNLKSETRNRDALREEQLARPLLDAWWGEHSVDLEAIDIPALVCASFSDHNLHTRGSFEGFRRIASRDKWLYTHRGGKWAEFYSDDALAFQSRFFDCFLKGEETGISDVPPVRLEVRDVGNVAHEVRAEHEWPLARTQWTPLYLHSDGTLCDAPAGASTEVAYDTARGRASFSFTFRTDTEVTGPMKLRLHLEARGADDLVVFAGVRKLRDGREVVFEGSYGFGRDMVTRGWLKASHRRLDEASTPQRPVLRHDREEKLLAGEIVAAEIELMPSATLFRAGDVLRLDVQGRYFYRRHPLLGQFPAGYELGAPGTAVLHCGDTCDAHLLVPVIPR